uniref:Uncharacterized protein n=1 Tax=Fagus sylvatica TaxID=28930 RepID=A0A2N9FRM2_FAGSY
MARTKATMAKDLALSPAPRVADAATNLGSGFLFLSFSPFSLSLSWLLSLLPLGFSPLGHTALSLSHLDWTKAMSWLWGLVVD